MSASGAQQVPYQVHQGRPLGATYQTREFLNSQLFRLILEAVKDKRDGLQQAYRQIREQNGENTLQYLSKECYNITIALAVKQEEYERNFKEINKKLVKMDNEIRTYFQAKIDQLEIVVNANKINHDISDRMRYDMIKQLDSRVSTLETAVNQAIFDRIGTILEGQRHQEKKLEDVDAHIVSVQGDIWEEIADIREKLYNVLCPVDDKQAIDHNQTVLNAYEERLFVLETKLKEDEVRQLIIHEMKGYLAIT